MKTTFINTPDDMDWLRDTHLPKLPKHYVKGSAVIHGNEDCPDRIDVYTNQDPFVYESYVSYSCRGCRCGEGRAVKNRRGR